MPTPSGSAFHFLTHSGSNSSHYGGILPDPLPLEPQEVMTISGYATNVAVSGQLQYNIVEPGDYPTSQDERERRRGAVRVK
jgi:hypothetical protein